MSIVKVHSERANGRLYSTGDILFSTVSGGPRHVHTPREVIFRRSRFNQAVDVDNFVPASLSECLVDADVELPTMTAKEVESVLSSLIDNSSNIKTKKGLNDFGNNRACSFDTNRRNIDKQGSNMDSSYFKRGSYMNNASIHEFQRGGKISDNKNESAGITPIYNVKYQSTDALVPVDAEAITMDVDKNLAMCSISNRHTTSTSIMQPENKFHERYRHPSVDHMLQQFDHSSSYGGENVHQLIVSGKHPSTSCHRIFEPTHSDHASASPMTDLFTEPPKSNKQICETGPFCSVSYRRFPCEFFFISR